MDGRLVLSEIAVGRPESGVGRKKMKRKRLERNGFWLLFGVADGESCVASTR